jgi:ABC-type multidrug transport system ATPase subunit
MQKAGIVMQLECRDIQFCYPQSANSVLDDLSLVLNTPGLHGLFGPSGVGKTSLAKIIAGTIQPSAGKIRTEGLEMILYCHNLERLPGWSSVGRHLERITPHNKAELKERLLSRFGLTDCLGRRFGRLSLGQRNRLNLVRYLVQDLQVLIMDESLANVDEHTRGTILTTLKELFPEVLFLYISHNVIEVARYCNHIWVLRDRTKRPQAVRIQGMNLQIAEAAGPQALEKTMLEMMNAA